MNELTREVRFEKGYDRRNETAPDGSRYGCHGLQIRFLLRGEQGVVQFVMLTDWLPTDVTTDALGLRVDREGRGHERIADLMPMAADLGYHWPTARYDGQAPMSCDLLAGGQCFYDGSGLNAERVMARLYALRHRERHGVWGGASERERRRMNRADRRGSNNRTPSSARAQIITLNSRGVPAREIASAEGVTTRTVYRIVAEARA